MRTTKEILRPLAILVAALSLVLWACSDDESTPSPDTTPDQDAEQDMVPDMEPDMVPDMEPDVEPDVADVAPDVPPPTDLCLTSAAALAADDGALASDIGDIVSECIFGPCLQCGLAGINCGDGGTIESCMTDCITNNEFGDCSVDACDEGFTCTADVCKMDAGTAVGAAVVAGDLELECVACFVGITVCGAQSCSTECLSDDCQCESCRCDEGCEAAFATCSGIPSLALDCTSVPEDPTVCLDDQDPPQPTGDCSDSTLEACGGTPSE